VQVWTGSDYFNRIPVYVGPDPCRGIQVADAKVANDYSGLLDGSCRKRGTPVHSKRRLKKRHRSDVESPNCHSTQVVDGGAFFSGPCAKPTTLARLVRASASVTVGRVSAMMTIPFNPSRDGRHTRRRIGTNKKKKKGGRRCRFGQSRGGEKKNSPVTPEVNGTPKKRNTRAASPCSTERILGKVVHQVQAGGGGAKVAPNSNAGSRPNG